ncbi:MAG: mucoidy inhibitor MuiA family protein [Desulfobacterales bacterium]|nr:mucoidy inhibitor MuiA family protein [Desulfobacterales bacterium]
MPVQTDGNRTIARFSIPVHADKDTLTANTPAESGMLVTSIRTELLTPDETDKVKELKNKLNDLLRQKADIDARIKADTAYISFWENLGSNLPEKTESVERLADAARKGITDAHNEIFKLTQSLEPLNNKIDDIQKQIDNLTGHSEKHWQVAVYLNKKAADTIALTYSYYIGNCGWEPVYTLNAHPGKSEIEFVWYADITQNTGLHWDNIDLTLAAAQARPQPEPPLLGDWIIAPVQIYPQRKAAMAPEQLRASAPAEMDADHAESAPPEPTRSEGFLFDTFALGKQTLAPGEAGRIDIRKSTWKAAFRYLIRPYESPQAFLFAQLEIAGDKNEFIKLPQGMATFLIDSAVVSSRSFSLVDPEEKLYFGSDPQVNVKMDVLSKKSGEKGIFAGKKTYEWGWKITLNNLKNHEINILMEDAYPQLQDERIKLEESFSGVTPEKDKNLLKWAVEVKPRSKTDIQYGFSIIYPDDLNLNFGGR